MDQGPPPGHSHAHGRPPEVEVGRTARIVLLAFLALAGLGTVLGLLLLWPADDEVPEAVAYAAEGVSFTSAEVVSLGPPCPVISSEDGGTAPAADCNRLVSDVDGEEVTLTVPSEVADSGLREGDTVKLMLIPATAERAASYGYIGIERPLPLTAMAIAFVLVVALVARVRGLLALVGLGIAGATLAWFMLPALLAGENGAAVALVGSSAIMFVVLYLAHGISLRTSTALAGTLLGVLVTALIGWWAVGATRLSGVSDETAMALVSQAPDINFQGLLTAAVIIAGLGVLNDVTITQSSAVWELRSAAPEMSRASLFASGMRIGRDHIGSTIYTIVFAYAGSALALLLLLSLYDRPLGHVLLDDPIVEEIVRTLASGIGLVLAVPITTAIAALTVSGAPQGRVARKH
ncbi:YibE/F family protein [Nocardioides pacificus]